MQGHSIRRFQPTDGTRRESASVEIGVLGRVTARSAAPQLVLRQTEFPATVGRSSLNFGTIYARLDHSAVLREGKNSTSHIGTLGMAGVFICVPNPPVVGTSVRLAFEVPGGNVTPEAVVRSTEPGKGMGVEFTKVGPGERVLLQRLLKRLLRV